MKKLKNFWLNIIKRSDSFENLFATIVLILLALMPTIEVVLRKFFKTGIHSSALYIQHLTLWSTFICGMIASREKKHLALSAGVDIIKEPVQTWIKTATSTLAVMISFAFFFCALSFVFNGFDSSHKIGIFSIRFILALLPIGFLVIAVRFFKQSPKGLTFKLITGLGFILGLLFGFKPLLNFFENIITHGSGFASILESLQTFSENSLTPFLGSISIPFIILLIISAFLGTPIFIVLGGVALLSFVRANGFIEVIPNEAYTVLTSPTIPAIPLFTLAGFILSESNAGKRLIRFFTAYFGWLPGNAAIISILVCSFFTTFTGASGVTILALGGLLYFILTDRKYKKEFSLGLLTASGSSGLLFPPSLPIIMYAVVAQISIKEMFVGGILPGVVMVLALIIMSIRHAFKNKIKKQPLDTKELLPSFIESLGEILLPVIILLGFFLGITTLVETSAIAVVYVLILEVFIKKDIKFADLPKVIFKSIPVIGGVLIIIALARGFNYYIVDAEVPMKITQWCQEHIQSKYVFLLLLNIALLITGCLMDIYSAILVVVPLIIPLGQAYGVHPVHLGIIFLTNLQLGYLTPPVGMNLFLSSYRFDEPLVKIYKDVLPFLLFLLTAVLFITYVPWITTWLLGIIKF